MQGANIYRWHQQMGLQDGERFEDRLEAEIRETLGGLVGASPERMTAAVMETIRRRLRYHGLLPPAQEERSDAPVPG